MFCFGPSIVGVIGYEDTSTPMQLHIHHDDNTDTFSVEPVRKGLNGERPLVRETASGDQQDEKKSRALMAFLRRDVIGSDATFIGPFGKKHLIYCDYTASGRSVRFIEKYIADFVCPYYANTHTNTSIAARQTSSFREDARNIIKKCVNASDDDVVIYTGNGTTGAIHKLIAGLKLTNGPESPQDAVVFMGPYEHHSNILPWNETGAKIIRIGETKKGELDLSDLESQLKLNEKRTDLRVVTCSAVSNVTGIITNVDEVARISHKYGAYAVFDYASGAPYLHMDMNPSAETYKDAIVCSPHKFVGGPGTPGLLISKRHMFSNIVPDRGGGGTVVYVTRNTYAYIKDIEAREEGGTPAIVESIRCGMVFQLKQAVGPENIECREDQLTKRAFRSWSKNATALIILGSHTAKRLPVFSFIVKHPASGKYIHHNYFSVILNDVFGIQSRGGCACAGPYAEDLLGITENMAQNFSKLLTESCDTCTAVHLKSPLEIMKPGFCRLNFPYFMDDETADYVIDAVSMAVEEGWKLMPQYTYNAYNGEWKHRSLTDNSQDTIHSLYDVDYSKPHFGLRSSMCGGKTGVDKLNVKKALKSARKTFDDAEKMPLDEDVLCEDIYGLLEPEERSLVWFLQPKHAYDFLDMDSGMFPAHGTSTVPFKPPTRFSIKARRISMFLGFRKFSMKDRRDRMSVA